MKLRLIAIAAAAALAWLPAARAAEPAPKATLTNAQALTLLMALRGLDSRPVIVKTGTNETTVPIPWEFGSAALRVRISKNVAALEPVEKNIETARNVTQREIGKGKPIPRDTPEWETFVSQMTDLMAQPAGTLDLARIRASELKLDKNEIPGSTLAGLTPIFDDDITPK